MAEPVGPSPLVSALVVTYQSAADVDSCLRALTAQEVSNGMDITVVDNASDDGTVEHVRRNGGGANLIELGTNTGYAGGNNLAATQSHGEVLLLVNPDAVVDPGCVQALVDHLRDHPGVGAVAATLRSLDGSPQLFARRRVSFGAVVWDMTELGRRFDARYRNRRGANHRRYANEMRDGVSAPIEVDCPAAACIAVWRTLATPRLYDETLPLFFNDADLYDRLRSRGYTVEVTPAATAQHGYGTSQAQIDPSRRRAEFVASLRTYCSRRWGLMSRILLWLILFADAAGCVTLGALTRNARLRNAGRGTAGGLWLPGGAAPWLSRRLSPWSAIGREVRRVGRLLRRTIFAVGQRRRRLRLLRKIRWQAWLLRAPVDVHIARNAEIGHVTVELKAGRRSRLVIGDSVMVNDGVIIRLWGGSLEVGSHTLVRHRAVLTVKGTLDIGAHTVISRDVQVHADGVMRLGFGTALAERVTVIDTEHTFDDIPTQIFDKTVRQSDVTIEPFAFVGTGSVVTKGVTIGRSAVVGALSVASRDVPSAMIAVGSPAAPIRGVTRRLCGPRQMSELEPSAAPAPGRPTA